MITSLLFYVIVLALLLGVGAIFSAAETALFSLSRAQIERFKNSRQSLSKGVIQYLSKPRDLLVTILFGNEILNIAFSVIMASFIYDLMGPANMRMATILSVALATILILIFSEIIPKSIAIRNAPSLAPFMVVFLKPLYFFLGPLRVALVKLADWIVARFGGELKKESPLIVEEEFRYLLELGATAGQVDKEEKELIHKVFEFEEKIVSQIMTPFEKTFCLPTDTPFDDLLRQVKETQFSRIPVYEKTPANIIGVLYVKDLFQFSHRLKTDPSLSIREILRQPLFVPKHQKLEETLQNFRELKIHMGIVVDQNKNPVGVVTMHDISEELFGKVEA
ncbi:MAG: hemolysin family protein [Deltaproteobacteria bacterium]|nr:hemolysin family protein [Deltaproteobacteria bacterium]